MTHEPYAADAMGVRLCEHPSLAEFLRQRVRDSDLAQVGIVSFNQWPFSVAALSEIALTLHGMGSAVTVAFWADRTPLPDPGWSTSRHLSFLLRSPSVDKRAEQGLLAAGLSRTSIAAPPIRRWTPTEMPGLPRPLTRAAIRQLQYRDSAMGRSILQVHPDRETPVRDDFEWPDAWIARAMESYAWAYDQTFALVQERSLSTVIVYNGRFTHDRAAAAAAEAAGARVLYYDNGGLGTDFDLTVVPIHDWSDLQDRMKRLWDSWPESEREALARSWFDGRRTHTEPSIHKFVAVQERGHIEGVPDAETLVVYFSSSGDEFAELDLDWSQHLDSQEQALMALAEACRARPGTSLVVRTHPHMRLKPKDDLRAWTAAVEAAAPDVHLDPFSPVDSYELMQRADIVCTYGSTSGVEAAVLGTSVIVMGPSAYDELGCAKRVRRPEELPSSIDSPPPADPLAALPYGLMMMRRGFIFEQVKRRVDNVPVVGGVPLEEPSRIVQNLSHARLERLKRRLMSRRGS